jgi:hypothetical protein
MFDYSPNISPSDSYGAGKVIKHAQYSILVLDSNWNVPSLRMGAFKRGDTYMVPRATESLREGKHTRHLQ